MGGSGSSEGSEEAHIVAVTEEGAELSANARPAKRTILGVCGKGPLGAGPDSTAYRPLDRGQDTLSSTSGMLRLLYQ